LEHVVKNVPKLGSWFCFDFDITDSILSHLSFNSCIRNRIDYTQ
jgi:hypothetical protein